MDSPITASLMPTYARADLAFERGEGAYLYTAEGERYLDFMAGIAVCALGHAHPHLVAALQEQAGKLWHCSNVFRIPGGERLADRLVEETFAERVFFCNSGAEALEASIKLTRKYQDDTGQPDRWRIVTCNGAFHGRTLTTISAAGNPAHLKGFAPDAPGFDHVAFNNLNELRNAITDETAGILVEPVQGEGGVRAAQLDFLKGLRAVCDEYGLLLIFDEVQCGMGRTGKLFAHEWAGIAPDVMAVAKGLGGGFPIGACLATEKASIGMTPGTHGTTFGGNPLAMASGNAVLDVILGDGFLERVDGVARRLWRELEALVARHPAVLEDVRGAGLMLGLKCKLENRLLLAKLRERKMLAVGASDNVLRLLPPLIVGESEVGEAIDKLDAACSALAAEAA
ncbi:MAG: aspartate aminotransferase family protein [Rhodovibrionaceae bacterium]